MGLIPRDSFDFPVGWEVTWRSLVERVGHQWPVLTGACIPLKGIKSLPRLQLGLLPRAAQVQTPAQQVPGLPNSDSTSRQESSPLRQCLQPGSRAAGPARGTKLPWAMPCPLLQQLPHGMGVRRKLRRGCVTGFEPLVCYWQQRGVLQPPGPTLSPWRARDRAR